MVGLGHRYHHYWKADRVPSGKITPKVDSVYSFADVHKAYERMMSSRATGKVVVRVDPEAE